MDIQQLSIIVKTKRNSNEVKFLNDDSKICLNEQVMETFADQQKWRFYNYVEISNSASYEQEKITGNQTQCYSASIYISRYAL
jgi:hypothetical protein